MKSPKKPYPALERWLGDFVREFRRLYEALPEVSKERLSRLKDFRAPCRIVAFSATELEYQYVLVVKEPVIATDSTTVYELSPPESMISQAAAALGDRWFASVPEPARSTLDKKYKDVVRNHLLGILKTLPQARLRFPPREPGRTPLLQKGPDDGSYFEWTLFGNLLDSSATEFASSVLTEAVKPGGVGQPAEFSQPATPTPAEQPTASRTGFISAFSPGIWLGSPHDYSFREELDGYFVPLSTREVRLLYKHRELMVMLNGFLTIIEPDRQVCTELLNEIMCVALLLGVPATAVRDEDVAEAKFNGNGDLTQYTMEISSRRRAILAKEREPIRQEEYETYTSLSESQLREVVSKAEKCTLQEDQTLSARWYIDAHTSFDDSDYDRSVLKSWLVIERHINTMWRNHSKRASGALRKAESNKKRVLGDLLRWGLISPAEHAKLDELRVRRNAAFHFGRAAARKEADVFLKEAEAVTRTTLGISA